MFRGRGARNADAWFSAGREDVLVRMEAGRERERLERWERVRPVVEDYAGLESDYDDDDDDEENDDGPPPAAAQAEALASGVQDRYFGSDAGVVQCDGRLAVRSSGAGDGRDVEDAAHARAARGGALARRGRATYAGVL